MLRFFRVDPHWLGEALSNESQADKLRQLRDVVASAISLAGEADNTVLLSEPELEPKIRGQLNNLANLSNLKLSASNRRLAEVVVSELMKFLRFKNKTLSWQLQHHTAGEKFNLRLPDLDLKDGADLDAVMGAFHALTIGYFQEAFRKDIPSAPRVDLLTRMVVGSERVIVIDSYIDKHGEPAGRLLELLAQACVRSRRYGKPVDRIDVVQPYRRRADLSSNDSLRENWTLILQDVRGRLVAPLGLRVAVHALQAARPSERVHDRFVVGKLGSINITGGTRIVDHDPDGAINIRPSLLPGYQWIPAKLQKSFASPVYEGSI